MSAQSATPCLTAQAFTNLLLTELPVYSQEILRDVRPTDMLAAHVSSGMWDAFSGVQQYQDRFRNVKANTSASWQDVSETTCVGAPCDPVMNEICWGWERVQYGQKIQSWKSQLLCFDQEISATKAVEHIAQIVSDILRPATSDVTSMFVRKEALRLASNKKVANSTFGDFTGTWEVDGNSEIFYTPSTLPTSKLTPEMLKRQIPLLRNNGYFGMWTNDPFWGGYENFAELITDDDTCWELDKIATNQRVSDLWRYQMWEAAHEYYKYGMGGQIGNYMSHVDPFCLRFNLNTSQGSNKLQLVLPFKNVAADSGLPGAPTVGLGSIPNPDYFAAQYQISFIWHRFAWQLLTQQMQQVNPLMPFLNRDLSGQWTFAINDLGQDCNGNTIANFRKNKGFFYADWRLAAKPQHTEWLTAILHLREQAVIYAVEPCATDPGYPTQEYNSACASCDTTYRWIPTKTGSNYVLAIDTVTCNGDPIPNGAISAATLAALVTALGADATLGALGTWSQNGTQLILTGATCQPVLPWV